MLVYQVCLVLVMVGMGRCNFSGSALGGTHSICLLWTYPGEPESCLLTPVLLVGPVLRGYYDEQKRDGFGNWNYCLGSS